MQPHTNYTPGIIPSMFPGAEDASVQGAFYILLFGCAGTGKTSFVNAAAGGKTEIEMGVRGTTRGVLISEPFYVDDKPVVLIDFPGFNDAHMNGMEVLRRLAELPLLPKNGYKIAGFLYMHNITDTRVGGASLRSMNVFKALCGTESLRNAVYVTNLWSNPPTRSELKREQELRESDDFFGGALSLGARMARHTGSQASAHDIIRLILFSDPVVPKFLRQLVDEKLALENTDAAHALSQDAQRNDLYQAYQQELADLRDGGIGSSNKEQSQRSEVAGSTYPLTQVNNPLPDLRHIMEQQGNESERFKHDLGRMDKSWANHQEENKRQEEHIKQLIANIGSSTPNQQDRPTPWLVSKLNSTLALGRDFLCFGLSGHDIISGHENSQVDAQILTTPTHQMEYVASTYETPEQQLRSGRGHYTSFTR